MITSCASFALATSRLLVADAEVMAAARPECGVWYVGVYYPGRGKVVDNGVRGFELTHLELGVIATQLVGMPVTYEHKGIATAVGDNAALHVSPLCTEQVFAALNKAALDDVIRAPVGVIVDAWQAWNGDWMCAFFLKNILYPRLSAMIDGGSLAGLSLSHLHGACPQALEVSLCVTPARPACTVVAGPFASPCERERYKAITCAPPCILSASSSHAGHPSKMAVNDSSAAPTATNMAQVLAAMTDADRTLISAAFNDMNQKLDATKTQNEALTSQYAEIEKAAVVDKRLLQSQLDVFLGQLDDPTKQRFNLTPAACTSGVVEASDVNTMRRNVDRLLMCCNSVMMQGGHTPANAGVVTRKRSASVHDAADADVGGHPQSSTFEPAAVASPADALRNALRQF